jgi:hypothetical protein
MHTRDKKLYGLQNIGGLLGAKELSHHRQALKKGVCSSFPFRQENYVIIGRD